MTRKNLSLFLIALCLAAVSFAGDHAHGSAKSCPMKDKKVAELAEVEMTGKIVCMSCNLAKEDECRKVFQASDEQKTLYDLCPNKEIKDLEEVSEHGEATVVVKGTMMKSTEG